MRCVLFTIHVLNLIGVIILLVLAFVALKTSTNLLKTGPGLVDDYIRNNVGGFIDEHIRENVPEVVQAAVLTLMVGQMSGASSGAPALPAGQQDEYVHRTRSECNGVHSDVMCTSFHRTCTDFHTCRARRTNDACSAFVNDLAYTCNINRCDAYDDRTACDRVNVLCRHRIAALWNVTARENMESELVSLCAAL